MTVTLNPALDREIFIDDFTVDALHRVEKNRMNLSPGGKGVNVSVALAKLGIPSIALGFVGGYMGRILVEELRKTSQLITTNFVHIRGETRENIAIIDEKRHTITEINASGPEVDELDVEHLIRRFDMSLSRVETVVISGSVPPNLGSEIYVKLVRIALEKGVPVFMEVTDEFVKMLGENQSMPFVIKPDFRARSVLFGKELNKLEDFVEAGKELVRLGSELAVLSYYIDRDVIVTRDGVWLVGPKFEIDHSHLLGTGDTYVAAMVYKFLMGEKDLVEIAKFGYIAALAKTKKAKKELPTLDDIESIKDLYVIERVS